MSPCDCVQCSCNRSTEPCAARRRGDVGRNDVLAPPPGADAVPYHALCQGCAETAREMRQQVLRTMWRRWQHAWMARLMAEAQEASRRLLGELVGAREIERYCDYGVIRLEYPHGTYVLTRRDPVLHVVTSTVEGLRPGFSYCVSLGIDAAAPVRMPKDDTLIAVALALHDPKGLGRTTGATRRMSLVDVAICDGAIPFYELRPTMVAAGIRLPKAPEPDDPYPF